MDYEAIVSKIQTARARYLKAMLDYRRAREMAERTIQEAEHEFSQAIAELLRKDEKSVPSLCVVSAAVARSWNMET